MTTSGQVNFGIISGNTYPNKYLLNAGGKYLGMSNGKILIYDSIKEETKWEIEFL